MDASKKIIIIDASIALKWALNEAEDREKAIAIRDDVFSGKYHVAVPAHFLLEMGNTLALKLEKYALVFLSFLITSDVLVQCALSISVTSKALEIVKKYKKTTFYDAVYHALALEEGGVFITADRDYYNKVKKEGGIMLLKDW